MSGVFLDTSGWFAALSPREAQHRTAAATYRGLVTRRVPLVTTNLIVAEMQILISRARGQRDALRFLDALYQEPGHEVVFVDRDLERAAIEHWLRRFADQRMSLADAVSFAVMRSRRLKQALALDAHFELAGFELLP